MENEQRGCTSRTSSTSSLGREVRCGCQFYQSDSLLPERRALLGRPQFRTNMMQTLPPHTRVPHPSEHEYESIAPPPPPTPPIVSIVAPVVRITDTDLLPVADSDDSIDDRGRFHSGLTLDGDIILPLDGRLEDSAMEVHELGETIDTSDEQESAQQLQDRLEESFLRAPCPDFDFRTQGEINASQAGTSVQEELPGKHSIYGFPNKLRNQAGKLRSRLRGIQRPTFIISVHQRSEKKKSASNTVTEKSKTEKASKMERFKMALPVRPRFSFRDSLKRSLPNRSKFNIKRPNIHLPSAFNRSRKGTSSPQEQQRQRSTESACGSRKNIFDFSTYSRIFDKKLKNKDEYVTSSPKESRSESAESTTFSRSKETLRARWTQRFRDTKLSDEEFVEQRVAIERSRPWRHPSLEEPRLACRIQASESLEECEKLPWEIEQKTIDYREEIQYADYDEDSQEPSDQRASRSSDQRQKDESFDKNLKLDIRLYGDQAVDQEMKDFKNITEIGRSGKYAEPKEEVKAEEVNQVEVLNFKRMESFENGDNDNYEGSFSPVDPRQFDIRKISSEERSSIRSDREQQSSGSSCERLGVVEKIDSDEFFLREKGIGQEDMSVGRYIVSEIREALRTTPQNVLKDEDTIPIPPRRPNRTRSLRRTKTEFLELCSDFPPAKPKRERSFCYSEESFGNLERKNSFSSVTHKVVYQTETVSSEQSPTVYTDGIVIVKPARRKSRISLRSESQGVTGPIQPVVPSRRRQIRIQNGNGLHQSGIMISDCNGHDNGTTLKNSLYEEHPQTPSTPPLAPVTGDQKIMGNLPFMFEQEISEHPPVPPKRRSRSRTASFIQDEDRTSHGAESIPEVGYIEDDFFQDDSQDQLTGYAVIEKCEKPPRPPLPKRRRHKFATTPRLTAPKRPQRAYSTLGPARRKTQDTKISQLPKNVTQYIEVESDGEHMDLRSGEVLSKMQSRPLPAPPRPPRSQWAAKESADYYEPESIHTVNEAVASTQTDPLPDDIVIEEEITQAKLVMAPSRYGSQVLISTERKATPTISQTPPIRPLPAIHSSEDRIVADREGEEENQQESREDISRAALFSNEPLRINSLEVGDLRVNQLSVSQLEAYKITTSEMNTIVVSASEISGKASTKENEINSSLLQELITIRSYLETVAQVHETPSSRVDDAYTDTTSDKRIGVITPSTIRTQESIRASPAREIKTAQEIRSGRLDIEKMDITKEKAKQIATKRMQLSSESEILQAQVLQVEKLKPDMEVKAFFMSNSRESSVEKEEKCNQKLGRRSRSASPSLGPHPLRQTASPPLISVTPDTTDCPLNHPISSEPLPQCAIISCFEGREQSCRELTQSLEENSSPNVNQFVTFQTSQIPTQFLSLASPTSRQVEAEPDITETTRQLLRAIRIIVNRTMRHFVNYIASRVGREEFSDKIKQVELILCALLLIVAGLLIMLFRSPHTETHHHHWDYFNPPQ